MSDKYRMWGAFSVVRARAFGKSEGVSATEATAEVFVTAFRALKQRERDAVLQKLVADTELADDLADTLALEARRHQSRTPLRAALKDLRIRV